MQDIKRPAMTYFKANALVIKIYFLRFQFDLLEEQKRS